MLSLTPASSNQQLFAALRCLSMLAACCLATTASTPALAAPAIGNAVAQASADYVIAFNDRDYESLASQWTADAELVEGGSRVVGREEIVASIRGWLDRHPDARIGIEVGTVTPLAATLARVEGIMTFSRTADALPVVSRFVSLRVLEEGSWKLAESVVEPASAAAVEDLDWLLGSWSAKSADGGSIQATFEKVVGGHAILGQMTVTAADGSTLEAIEIIHADRIAHALRSWVFDSRGATATGLIESDGITLNRTLVGTPSPASGGRRSSWVQLIMPGGADAFTLHSVERSIDGRRLPDADPLHFRRTLSK